MFEFFALAQECAPTVAPQTMAALVQVESAYNPYAIGVVGGAVRQPRNLDDAVRTAEALEAAGKNFSLGIAQVNRHNLARHNLTYRSAFEPCANLSAGAAILQECYERAALRFDDTQTALRASLSCYYSGNFLRGFVPDAPGQKSYVEKVLAAAGLTPVVPALSAPARPTGGQADDAPPKPSSSEPAPVPLRAVRAPPPNPAPDVAKDDDFTKRNPKVVF